MMNEYETITSGNENDARDRRVTMNEYEKVANGSVNDARDRHL